MKKIVSAALAASTVIGTGVLWAQQATVVPPPWAYGFAAAAPPPSTNPAPAAPAAPPAAGGGAPAAAAPAPDPTPRQAKGSTLQFTAAQANDRFGPADWFPGDHPQPIPDIVAKGRQAANILACGFCHYPNGQGRPENAGVGGLPYEYFVQTMQDFRDGNRKSADPRKGNTNTMIGFAKAMTDDEIKAAAKYFAGVKRQPDYIKIVESESSPKFRINAGMFIATEGADAGMEALAGRIVEVPEDAAQTEGLRNPARRSSPMSRSAAWPRASRSSPVRSAARATAPTSKASVRCRGSPAGPRLMWRASCSICSRASATGCGRN